MIGAGSVVVRDIAPNTLANGNPARVLQQDYAGYNGVRVV